jgi:glycerol-3-phosphate acyltransferase PlsX
MGGDHAPLALIEGANQALALYPEYNFLLFGNEEIIRPILSNYPLLKARSELIHTDKAILTEDKPSAALRRGRESSMWQAIDAVHTKHAAAIVSAGNTGALMAISKLTLKTLPQIDRPAIAGILPTLTGKAVMLDLGANAECTANNLYQFAVMGDAFAKVLLNLESPSIGLLNIGSEDAKGNEIIRAAHLLLKESAIPLNYHGYIEGHNIAEGKADVIVADGFSGNVALKTAEGTAKVCKEYFKRAFNSSLLAKLGFLLAKPTLKKVSDKLDSRLYNGAMLLGLNGIVVKSHGSADKLAFCNAISVAIETAQHNINDKISKEILASQGLAATTA